uniref:EGF-like domain-containing protein n=1 Tax=Macrostomum lignano TaxID=282301 RepID=A0A1I8FPS7_9PLAT
MPVAAGAGIGVQDTWAAESIADRCRQGSWRTAPELASALLFSVQMEQLVSRVSHAGAREELPEQAEMSEHGSEGDAGAKPGGLHSPEQICANTRTHLTAERQAPGSAAASGFARRCWHPQSAQPAVHSAVHRAAVGVHVVIAGRPAGAVRCCRRGGRGRRVDKRKCGIAAVGHKVELIASAPWVMGRLVRLLVQAAYGIASQRQPLVAPDAVQPIAGRAIDKAAAAAARIAARVAGIAPMQQQVVTNGHQRVEGHGFRPDLPGRHWQLIKFPLHSVVGVQMVARRKFLAVVFHAAKRIDSVSPGGNRLEQQATVARRLGNQRHVESDKLRPTRQTIHGIDFTCIELVFNRKMAVKFELAVLDSNTRLTAVPAGARKSPLVTQTECRTILRWCGTPSAVTSGDFLAPAGTAVSLVFESNTASSNFTALFAAIQCPECGYGYVCNRASGLCQAAASSTAAEAAPPARTTAAAAAAAASAVATVSEPASAAQIGLEQTVLNSWIIAALAMTALAMLIDYPIILRLGHPPRLYGHSLTRCGDYLYLYGGMDRDPALLAASAISCGELTCPACSGEIDAMNCLPSRPQLVGFDMSLIPEPPGNSGLLFKLYIIGGIFYDPSYSWEPAETSTGPLVVSVYSDRCQCVGSANLNILQMDLWRCLATRLPPGDILSIRLAAWNTTAEKFSPSDHLYAYDTVQRKFYKLPVSPGQVWPKPMAFHSLVSIGDYLLLHGAMPATLAAMRAAAAAALSMGRPAIGCTASGATSGCRWLAILCWCRERTRSTPLCGRPPIPHFPLVYPAAAAAPARNTNGTGRPPGYHYVYTYGGSVHGRVNGRLGRLRVPASPCEATRGSGAWCLAFGCQVGSGVLLKSLCCLVDFGAKMLAKPRALASADRQAFARVPLGAVLRHLSLLRQFLSSSGVRHPAHSCSICTEKSLRNAPDHLSSTALVNCVYCNGTCRLAPNPSVNPCGSNYSALAPVQCASCPAGTCQRCSQQPKCLYADASSGGDGHLKCRQRKLDGSESDVGACSILSRRSPCGRSSAGGCTECASSVGGFESGSLGCAWLQSGQQSGGFCLPAAFIEPLCPDGACGKFALKSSPPLIGSAACPALNGTGCDNQTYCKSCLARCAAAVAGAPTLRQAAAPAGVLSVASPSRRRERLPAPRHPAGISTPVRLRTSVRMGIIIAIWSGRFALTRLTGSGANVGLVTIGIMRLKSASLCAPGGPFAPSRTFCTCLFGYTGDTCDVACDCNGHSNCAGPSPADRATCLSCHKKHPRQPLPVLLSAARRGRRLWPGVPACSQATLRAAAASSAAGGNYRLGFNACCPASPASATGTRISACRTRAGLRLPEQHQNQLHRPRPALPRAAVRRVCADFYSGKPTDGRQCYHKMGVNNYFCLDYRHSQKACGVPDPPATLPTGRTLFFQVNPGFLNIDVRLFVDIIRGAADLYLALSRPHIRGEQHRRRQMASGPIWSASIIKQRQRCQGQPDGRRRRPSPASSATRRSCRIGVLEVSANPYLTYVSCRLSVSGSILIVRNATRRVLITIPCQSYEFSLNKFYLGVSTDVNVSALCSSVRTRTTSTCWCSLSMFFSCFFLLFGLVVLAWKARQCAQPAGLLGNGRERERQSMAARPFGRPACGAGEPGVPGAAGDRSCWPKLARRGLCTVPHPACPIPSLGAPSVSDRRSCWTRGLAPFLHGRRRRLISKLIISASSSASSAASADSPAAGLPRVVIADNAEAAERPPPTPRLLLKMAERDEAVELATHKRRCPSKDRSGQHLIVEKTELEMRQSPGQLLPKRFYLAEAAQVSVRTCATANPWSCCSSSFACADQITDLAWSPDSPVSDVRHAQEGAGADLLRCVVLEHPDWACKIDEGVAGLVAACWAPDSRRVLTTADFNLRDCVSVFNCGGDTGWQLVAHFDAGTEDLDGLALKKEKVNEETTVIALTSSLFADDTTVIGTTAEIEQGTATIKRIMEEFEERTNDEKEEHAPRKATTFCMLGTWLGRKNDTS